MVQPRHGRVSERKTLAITAWPALGDALAEGDAVGVLKAVGQEAGHQEVRGLGRVVGNAQLEALVRAAIHVGQVDGETVVAQLLTEIDGIQGLQGVVVVAATNRPELIDPALLRPGRFDMLVALAPPDDEARLAILRVHTRSMPLAGDVDLARIAATTEALTGAELEALCRRAALGAVREQLAAWGGSHGHGAEADVDSLHVAARHFDGASRELAAERQALGQEAGHPNDENRDSTGL